MYVYRDGPVLVLLILLIRDFEHNFIFVSIIGNATDHTHTNTFTKDRNYNIFHVQIIHILILRGVPCISCNNYNKLLFNFRYICFACFSLLIIIWLFSDYYLIFIGLPLQFLQSPFCMVHYRSFFYLHHDSIWQKNVLN